MLLTTFEKKNKVGRIELSDFNASLAKIQRKLDHSHCWKDCRCADDYGKQRGVSCKTKHASNICSPAVVLLGIYPERNDGLCLKNSYMNI